MQSLKKMSERAEAGMLPGIAIVVAILVAIIAVAIRARLLHHFRRRLKSPAFVIQVTKSCLIVMEIGTLVPNFA